MAVPLLERAIAAISPTWAERRAVARFNLALLNGSRSTSGAGPGINDQAARAAAARVGTVDEDVKNFRARDLAAARSLMARNSWARGAVNSIVGNVVGRGMSAECDVRTRQGDPNTDINEAAEERFNAWAKTCDITGRRSLKALQRQLYAERWIAGEVFIRRHMRQDRMITGSLPPLALEVVSGEMLSDQTDEKVKQGVEINERGVPVAYHFLKSPESSDTVRVRAEDVIHFFRPHRPGAVRGLSPLAVVETSFEALRRYLNHELTRAGIASAFVALHKIGGAGIRGLQTSPSQDSTDAAGNSLLSILDGGGMLLTGGPQDSLESVAPAIQSTAFDPFVRLVLRSIATGLGISYELLARDFTQTNFSSARSSNLEDRRQWEPEQDDMADLVLSRIWDWYVDAAKVAQIRPLTQRDDWPVNWMAQGWLWVDPMKEAQALELACKLGVDNVIAASRRQGRDFYDNVRKKAEAERYAEDQGTTIGETGNVNDTDEGEEAAATPGASASSEDDGDSQTASAA